MVIYPRRLLCWQLLVSNTHSIWTPFVMNHIILTLKLYFLPCRNPQLRIEQSLGRPAHQFGWVDRVGNAQSCYEFFVRSNPHGTWKFGQSRVSQSLKQFLLWWATNRGFGNSWFGSIIPVKENEESWSQRPWRISSPVENRTKKPSRSSISTIVVSSDTQPSFLGNISPFQRERERERDRNCHYDEIYIS